MKAAIGILFMLLFSALLALLAWGSWKMHAHEKLSNLFLTKGQHIEVKVATADRDNRAWYDQFTNAVYISFEHEGRSYTTRCIQDSGWISEGDQVDLLYLPEIDEFHHPRQIQRQDNRSRLLEFSVSTMWRNHQKWQLMAMGFSVASLLFLLTAVIAIQPIPILIQLRRAAGTCLILAAAIYFTYNTWQYFQYYNQVRAGGHEATVTVLHTDYRSHSNKSNWWPSYFATVQYNNEEKIIPINEGHYERLQPNGPLKIIYNEPLNDMMPADYSREYSGIFISLFMWSLGGYLVYRFFLKKTAVQTILDRR